MSTAAQNLMKAHLYTSATYTADKALSLAKMLNEDESDNGGDFTYVAEVKDGFGRIQAFDNSGMFVGYF